MPHSSHCMAVHPSPPHLACMQRCHRVAHVIYTAVGTGDCHLPNGHSSRGGDRGSEGDCGGWWSAPSEEDMDRGMRQGNGGGGVIRVSGGGGLGVPHKCGMSHGQTAADLQAIGFCVSHMVLAPQNARYGGVRSAVAFRRYLSNYAGKIGELLVQATKVFPSLPLHPFVNPPDSPRCPGFWWLGLCTTWHASRTTRKIARLVKH